MTKLLALLVCLALPAGAAGRCRPIPGSDAVLTSGARLVLGEMHGNHETPRFVADLACLAGDHDVRVALEIPDDEQGRIDAYLRSNGDRRARRDLLDGPFWRRKTQDGRSSVAMLALLESLRHAGTKVVAFDTTDEDADRDLEMAKHLEAAFTRSRDTLFLVLVGNLHARKTAHPDFPQTFMAQHLERLGAQVMTLDVRYGQGTTWACMPTCGVQKIGRGPPAPVGITLGATPDGAYDGTFSIGTPTAAKPARGRGTR